MGSRRSRSNNKARWPELRGGAFCRSGLSASSSCAWRLARGPTSAPLPGVRPDDDAPAPRLLPGLAEVAGPEPPRPTPPVPPLAEVLVDPAAAAAAAGDVCATAHTQPIAAEATRATQANLEDRHFILRIEVSLKDRCCQYEYGCPSRAVLRLQMDTGRQRLAAAGLQERERPRKKPAKAGSCYHQPAIASGLRLCLYGLAQLTRARRAGASRTLAARQCHCFRHGGTRPAGLPSVARETATC